MYAIVKRSINSNLLPIWRMVADEQGVLVLENWDATEKMKAALIIKNEGEAKAGQDIKAEFRVVLLPDSVV